MDSVKERDVREGTEGAEQGEGSAGRHSGGSVLSRADLQERLCRKSSPGHCVKGQTLHTLAGHLPTSLQELKGQAHIRQLLGGVSVMTTQEVSMVSVVGGLFWIIFYLEAFCFLNLSDRDFLRTKTLSL